MKKPKTRVVKPKPGKKAGGKDEKAGVNENESKFGNPFDFGGLPERDLKKNLGCG